MRQQPTTDGFVQVRLIKLFSFFVSVLIFHQLSIFRCIRKSVASSMLLCIVLAYSLTSANAYVNSSDREDVYGGKVNLNITRIANLSVEIVEISFCLSCWGCWDCKSSTVSQWVIQQGRYRAAGATKSKRKNAWKSTQRCARFTCRDCCSPPVLCVQINRYYYYHIIFWINTLMSL